MAVCDVIDLSVELRRFAIGNPLRAKDGAPLFFLFWGVVVLGTVLAISLDEIDLAIGSIVCCTLMVHTLNFYFRQEDANHEPNDETSV